MKKVILIVGLLLLTASKCEAEMQETCCEDIMKKYSDYPVGVSGDSDTWTAQAENETALDAEDGFPFTADHPNDFLGFSQAAMKAAGILPNDTIETADASQIFEALTSSKQPVNLGFNSNMKFRYNPDIKSVVSPGGTEEISDGWTLTNDTSDDVTIFYRPFGVQLSGDFSDDTETISISNVLTHMTNPGAVNESSGSITPALGVRGYGSDISMSFTFEELVKDYYMSSAVVRNEPYVMPVLSGSAGIASAIVEYAADETDGHFWAEPVGFTFKVSTNAAGAFMFDVEGSALLKGAVAGPFINSSYLISSVILDGLLARDSYNDTSLSQTVELLGHVGTGFGQSSPNKVYSTRIYVKWPERLSWTPSVGEVTVSGLAGGSMGSTVLTAEQEWTSIGSILVNNVTEDGVLLFIDDCVIDSGVTWNNELVQSYLSAGQVSIVKP